jgi:hypothetical protein
MHLRAVLDLPCGRHAECSRDGQRRHGYSTHRSEEGRRGARVRRAFVRQGGMLRRVKDGAHHGHCGQTEPGAPVMSDGPINEHERVGLTLLFAVVHLLHSVAAHNDTHVRGRP